MITSAILIKKIFFSLLFVCIAQQTYCMENAENEKSLRNAFSKAVELAYKNGFSSPDCETIKNLITKGANPNWKIGEDELLLLNAVVANQEKDLFDFLLKHNADINAGGKYKITPLHGLAMMYKKYEKLNICVEDLVQHKADIKIKNDFGLTPLHMTISSPNSVDCIKSLIKCGANIDETSEGESVTPLALAVGDNDKNPVEVIEVIKTLCTLRASLAFVDTVSKNNIFHFLAGHDRKKQIQYIEPIITHARFDGFGKGSKKTVPFALWVLNNWETNNGIKLPKDIKLRIISNLSLSDLYPHKKLCTELLQKNYHHILLPAVHERVKNIKQILTSPNKNNQTALQYALESFGNNQKHINNIQPLLDETLLQKAYHDFLEHFPDILNSELEKDKKNLARQMFDNCTELFLE